MSTIECMPGGTRGPGRGMMMLSTDRWVITGLSFIVVTSLFAKRRDVYTNSVSVGLSLDKLIICARRRMSSSRLRRQKDEES
jgi:hypothetical protein